MHKRHFLISLALIALPFTGMAQPERFIEGTHYITLDTPVRTPTPDSIDVTEYFWYGCPACFQFEPLLENWTGKLPEDVTFNRLPTLGGGIREVHAQAYFTAQALGVVEEVHTPIFNAIHRLGNRLGNQEMVRELFAEHGVAEADFDDAWDSFGVDSGMKRALSQLRQYGTQVQSTPSIIVNGKYVVENQREVLEVVDFLIEKERNAN